MIGVRSLRRLLADLEENKVPSFTVSCDTKKCRIDPVTNDLIVQEIVVTYKKDIDVYGTLFLFETDSKESKDSIRIAWNISSNFTPTISEVSIIKKLITTKIDEQTVVAKQEAYSAILKMDSSAMAKVLEGDDPRAIVNDIVKKKIADFTKTLPISSTKVSMFSAIIHLYFNKSTIVSVGQGYPSTGYVPKYSDFTNHYDEWPKWCENAKRLVDEVNKIISLFKGPTPLRGRSRKARGS